MSHDLMLTALHSLGLVAICTLAYGSIQRVIGSAQLRRVTIGLLLGFASVAVMFQPFMVLDGYQIDSRDLFLALATAFGGLTSTLIAVGISASARLWIGGPDLPAGLVMMVLVCLLAASWARRTAGKSRRPWHAWLTLGAIVSAPLLLGMVMTGLISPEVAMARLGVDLITAFVFGKMFETELRRAQRERQLNRAASTDPLTGLPNRRALMDFVNSIDDDRRQSMALLIVDADHFKSINDSHGHAVGDQVLKAIADTLNSVIREGDIAARFGGEEFAVMLQVAEQADGFAVADRLRDALSQHHLIGGKDLKVTVSVGGTRIPADTFDFAAAYARADAALYSAKRLGRDRAVFA